MREALDRLRATRDDDGFTLVELIVAMFVIAGVLLVLMAVQVSALVTTVHGKQRQQGTAVANQVMEELRALPWSTLVRGVHTNFEAAGADPFVSGTTLVPDFDPSLDEPLVITAAVIADPAGPGQVPPAPPLYDASGSNLSVLSDPAVPDIEFKARSYVTRPDTIPENAVNLAVIVSWTPQNTDEERHVIVRSTAYSPTGGCGQGSTTPFLAACQAMMDADSSVQAASVTFTGYRIEDITDEQAVPVPSTLLPGTDYLRAQLSLASTSSTLTSFQAANMWSRITSGASNAATDTDTVESGGAVAANSASTDVGAAGAAPPNPPDVGAIPGDTSPRMITGDDFRLSLNPPPSVSGYARARAEGACLTGIPADQPCAQASVGSEPGASATLTLPDGNIQVFKQTGSATREAWTARFLTAPSSGGTVGCGSIHDAGCVSAGAGRSFGTFELGPGGWSRPDGGSGPAALVTLGSYQDSARVEHGVERGSVAPTLNRAGSLQFWDGSGMQTINLAPGQSASVTIPAVEREVGDYTVTAHGSVNVFPATTDRTGTDPECRDQPCGVTAEVPSVNISVSYTITDGTDAHVLVMGFDLGGLRASAKYQAEPES